MFNKKLICCYLYPITKYGYPPPAENTIKYIGEMASLGFRSIELEAIRKDHLDKVYELKEEIKRKLIDLNLEVPFFCIVLPGLSSPEKKIRHEILKLFEKGCEIAHVLGSIGVLDNAPLPPYQFPGDIPVTRHYEENNLKNAKLPETLVWKDYWQSLVSTYREACDIASSYKLSYNMHPAAGVLASNTDGFLYFSDAVNRENLRFNLDTANQFYGKDNLYLSLLRLNGKIDYIHISDNRGERVEHLPLNTGKIFWEQFFETLNLINYKGYLGIDIGGAETDITDLDQSYIDAARWIEDQYFKP